MDPTRAFWGVVPFPKVQNCPPIDGGVRLTRRDGCDEGGPFRTVHRRVAGPGHPGAGSAQPVCPILKPPHYRPHLALRVRPHQEGLGFASSSHQALSECPLLGLQPDQARQRDD